MQRTYCDKCKKEIDEKEKYLSFPYYCFPRNVGFTSSHLCEQCAEKFSKVVKRFLTRK